MKTLNIKKLQALVLTLMISAAMGINAQVGGWKADLIEDSGKALEP